MELVEKHNIPDSPRMALCLEPLLTKEVNKQREREEREKGGEKEREREREREREKAKQTRGTSVLEVGQLPELLTSNTTSERRPSSLVESGLTLLIHSSPGLYLECHLPSCHSSECA